VEDESVFAPKHHSGLLAEPGDVVRVPAVLAAEELHFVAAAARVAALEAEVEAVSLPGRPLAPAADLAVAIPAATVELT